MLRSKLQVGPFNLTAPIMIKSLFSVTCVSLSICKFILLPGYGKTWEGGCSAVAVIYLHSLPSNNGARLKSESNFASVLTARRHGPHGGPGERDMQSDSGM